jgi:hypothetical protein
MTRCIWYMQSYAFLLQGGGRAVRTRLAPCFRLGFSCRCVGLALEGCQRRTQRVQRRHQLV